LGFNWVRNQWDIPSKNGVKWNRRSGIYKNAARIPFDRSVFLPEISMRFVISPKPYAMYEMVILNPWRI
jgi:hypothetical protein